MLKIHIYNHFVNGMKAKIFTRYVQRSYRICTNIYNVVELVSILLEQKNLKRVK